jgi:hypothetical protein
MELAQVTKNSSAATAVRKKKAAEPVATAAEAVATSSENEVTAARPMADNSHSDIQGNCKRILIFINACLLIWSLISLHQRHDNLMRKRNLQVWEVSNSHDICFCKKEKLAYSFVIAVAPSADASADPHQELVNRILQVPVFL